MQEIPDQQQLLLDVYPVLFDRVYRFICSRVPNKEDTKDITQEVFLKGFTHMDQFDTEKGNCEQWIITIARNSIIDYWRGHTEIKQLEDIEEVATEIHRHATSDMDFELRISGLTLEEQALLRLRYIDDLTYAQIAGAMGKKPNAVRTTFSRLHKKLQLSWKYL